MEYDAHIKELKAGERHPAKDFENDYGEESEEIVYIYPRWSRLEIMTAIIILLAIAISVLDVYGAALVCR